MRRKKQPYYKISGFTKKIIFGILGVFCILEVFIFFPQIVDFLNGKLLTSSIINNTLVSLTNDNRIENNESILTENELLKKAAQLKAEDMANNGYFSHISPNGEKPWAWLKKVGYNYSYAGENLAINFSDSADIVSAWMNSPSHKNNIINKNYTEIGFGVAEGFYKGNKTVFVVQFFASPAGDGANSKAETSEASNKLNELMSASLTDVVKKLVINIFGNIHKAVVYLFGILATLASLLLLLNIEKYRERKLVLVCNLIIVGLLIFVFAFSFIALLPNDGLIALNARNASIAFGF